MSLVLCSQHMQALMLLWLCLQFHPQYFPPTLSVALSNESSDRDSSDWKMFDLSNTSHYNSDHYFYSRVSDFLQIFIESVPQSHHPLSRNSSRLNGRKWKKSCVVCDTSCVLLIDRCFRLLEMPFYPHAGVFHEIVSYCQENRDGLT